MEWVTFRREDMKKTALLFSILALAGCKVEMEKEVSLNKILNSPISEENAQVKLEVASCDDDDDTLTAAQQKIHYLFNRATLQECYSKDISSYAVFDVPVGIGKWDNNDISQLPDIAFVSAYNDKSKSPLTVIIKKPFKDRLDKKIKQI